MKKQKVSLLQNVVKIKILNFHFHPFLQLFYIYPLLFLYNIFIQLYGLGISMVGLFNEKAKHRSRANHFLPATIKDEKLPKPIVFHCASVGEFEQALPLYEELKKEHSYFTFSFFSPSGYQYAQKKYPNLSITYLPLDTASNMQGFLQAINPCMVIIIKYEFWYHFIHQTTKRNIPLFLVSGIFRKEQTLFKPLLDNFFKKMLGSFTHLFLQNEESKTLLKAKGITNITVVGDTRIDRVLHTKAQPFYDKSIESFKGNQPLFIAGSAWHHDVPLLQKIIKALPANYKIIIAPHEVNHFSTNWLKENVAYYLGYQHSNARVMILNTTGILSRAYKYADLTYIGGGLGSGLHNTLEPAVFLHPVLIGGNNFSKFNEAVELVEEGCIFALQPQHDMEPLITQLTNDADKRASIRKKLQTYFDARANISEKIAVLINKHYKDLP